MNIIKWRDKPGGKFWYIWGHLTSDDKIEYRIHEAIENNDSFSKRCFDINDYYHSEKEAQEALKRRYAETTT